VRTKRPREWLVRAVAGGKRDVDHPPVRSAQFTDSSLEPQTPHVLGQRLADKTAEDAMKVIDRQIGDVGEDRGRQSLAVRFYCVRRRWEGRSRNVVTLSVLGRLRQRGTPEGRV
jgi:hypothetical protein